MRLLILTLAGILLAGLPSLAGPLTGAPAIKLEVGDPAPGAPAPGNWALGVGFAMFNFKYEQTVGGTTFGDEWSQSGLIVSAEYAKPLSAGRTLAFGGWLAPLGSPLGWPDEGTFGQIHGRFGFTPNWGLEVGGLLLDADRIGKMLLHAVYQTESKGAKPFKLQAGVGLLTGTTVDFRGARLGTLKTGVSAFANASYPFSQSINGYLSVWLLSQKFQWDTATVGAGIPDSTSTTVQWSLGVSHDF